MLLQVFCYCLQKRVSIHNSLIVSSINNDPTNNTRVFFAYKNSLFGNAHIQTLKTGHCQATPPRMTCCHLHLVEVPSAHTFQIRRKKIYVLKPSIASTLIACHQYNVNLCKTVQRSDAHYNTSGPEGTTALVESGTVQLGWLGSGAAQLISISSYFSLVSDVNAPGCASNVH